MASPSYEVNERDREFFERELDRFVPPRIFDAHIHLGLRSDYHEMHRDLVANVPEVCDMATWREHMSWLAPGREVAGALVLPTTLAGDRMDAGNAFAATEAARDDLSGAAVMLHPAMSADELREAIAKHRPVALKPYHLMSPVRPTLDSTMAQFLPEHLVAVAHEAALPIVMHLVRANALADSENQRQIVHFCRTYPEMKLVLAHSARGFNPSHTVNGIDAIRGLDNIYFDNSCVCEPGATEAILKAFGPSRLMWGSDYPFSHLRGKCVAYNDTFAWLFNSNIDLGPFSVDGQQGLTLVGLESLRALKFAARSCGLTDAEVEGVFFDNAARLYGRR